VQNLGGTIRLESVEGQGATFVVELPAVLTHTVEPSRVPLG
jgi:signal transduction histidine kinase